MFCFFRNKNDQDIIAYLEVNDLWEESFITFFRLSEEKPCLTLIGEQYKMILSLFQTFSLLSHKESWSNKDVEWYPSKNDEKDELVRYKVKTIKEELLKKRQENN